MALASFLRGLKDVQGNAKARLLFWRVNHYCRLLHKKTALP
ncbi:hypothetical protein [Acetobacter persici]|nr:hypothetical protein [Acetobacter persici]